MNREEKRESEVMDLAIKLKAGTFRLSFGFYIEDEQNESFNKKLNELDEFDMGEAFWEMYYELEPEIENCIMECKLSKDNYASDLMFRESVFEWMKQRFTTIYSPVVIEVKINDNPAEIELPFDVEEAFFNLLSNAATDRYIQRYCLQEE